jgi:Domain of unknown function (DUF4157)
VPPQVQQALRSSGEPLDQGTRGLMEARFGHDFSHVRVHADARAAASARAVQALAWTLGHDVVFAAGHYAPTTVEGRKLLAHELTHVLQQSTGPRPTRGPATVSSPHDPDERQADRVAETVASRDGRWRPQPISVQASTAAPHLQRQSASPAAPQPFKTVTVAGVKLRGATHSRGHDIQRANTIFAPARVRFRLHRVDATNAESDSWLGGDTDLAISSSCTPTAEEVSAYTGAGATYHLSGRVRAFFVRSMSGASFDASSFHAGCGSATDEMVEVSNMAGGRELAHEFGHLLLNEGNSAHSPDTSNLMADPDPGTQLTPAQRATIYANA